jgi:ParB-like chromosome segregation protein Spo0J
MNEKYKIEYVAVKDLIPADYNPRKWSDKQLADLKESIKRYGFVDPAIINGSQNRKNIIIGAHMRIVAAKALGIETVPVVYIDIADIEKEKELNLRLNKNTGEFNFDLLAEFDEKFLADVGFDSEELDDIFQVESELEQFDINKELERLKIEKIEIEPGDIYILGDSKLMCGDSTVEADILRLMDGEKADLCLTDPPYILDYLNAKRHGKPTEGFGSKKNR